MKKSWSWVICGYDVLQYSLGKIIEICRTAGFSGVEGAPPLFGEQSKAELTRTGDELRSAGLTTRTFHLPFGSEDDIAGFYETDRRRAVRGIRSWMERAAAFGAEIVIQHPSVGQRDCRVEGVEPFLRQLGRSLDELLPAASELGLTIALENMASPTAERFFSVPEHFGSVIRDYVGPGLGFCFDTGHALISVGLQRYAEYYALLGPHVVCHHLADNAGNRDAHLPPGHGLVPWGALFRKSSELGFTHGMCIETPPHAPGPDYTVEAWAEMVAQVERLVDDALR